MRAWSADHQHVAVSVDGDGAPEVTFLSDFFGAAARFTRFTFFSFFGGFVAAIADLALGGWHRQHRAALNPALFAAGEHPCAARAVVLPRRAHERGLAVARQRHAHAEAGVFVLFVGRELRFRSIFDRRIDLDREARAANADVEHELAAGERQPGREHPPAGVGGADTPIAQPARAAGADDRAVLVGAQREGSVS